MSNISASLVKEQIAIQEATKLKIPIAAIIDSNSNPDGITYPIPGNDDSTKAIALYCDLISKAALDGIAQSQVQTEDNPSVGKVKKSKKEKIVPESIAPVTEESVTPVIEEVVAPVTEESVTPVIEEVVAPVIEETVAPLTEESVTPVTEESSKEEQSDENKK